MTMISDEIRELIDDEDLYPGQIAGLRLIADRIDAELVELPKDRDGAPIHVGDTVYLKDGRKGEVSRITLGREKTSIDLWMWDKGRFSYSVAQGEQGDMAHTAPDSWERIADDLEELSESNRVNGSGEVFYRAGELAARIRRLADKEEER